MFVQVYSPTTNKKLFLLLYLLTSVSCQLQFLILAILMGVRWNPGIVLICISRLAKDAEHFFKCFLPI